MTLEYIATSEAWTGERIDGIAYPRNIETLWTTEELSAIGLRVRVPPVPPTPDPIAVFTQAIEAHINDVASQKAYSGATPLASYLGSTVPQWAAEAQAFVVWRDSVWTYAYEQLAAVQSGQRQMPTVEAFLDEVPSIVWPA